jgi:hypothetical protein
MGTRDKAIVTVGPLFSSTFSHDRFLRWKAGNDEIADIFDKCILGEIYWRKSIGRPKTKSGTLAEGFSLRVWTEQHFKIDKKWKLRNHFPAVKLWDAEDDAQFWRVGYLVSGVEPGHFPGNIDTNDPPYDDLTHIVPVFNKVPWHGPPPPHEDDYLGFRVFLSYEIILVKEAGADHRSIQVVHSHLRPAQVKTPFSDDE